MADPQVVVIPIQGETRTEHVTRTVHEHRAPTDASVKLLADMEAAARARIEHAINVGGNGFECVVYTQIEAMSRDLVAVAVFKLNGTSMRAEARVEGWNSHEAETLPGKLRDALAQKIASHALVPALAAVKWPKL